MPLPTERLDHAEKLDKLEEKVIAEIDEPQYPVNPTNDNFPITEELEILDEEIPLAQAPKTGDLSSLWAAISGLSLGGISLLNFKRKKEEA